MSPSPKLLLSPDVGPDNPVWQDVRRRGIGASEIAAVLGICPWESSFSLWWRKQEGWSAEDTRELRRGRRLEAIVADEFAAVHPEYVVCPAGLYRHGEREWMLASPDRLLCDPQMHDNPFPGEVQDWPHPNGRMPELLECKTAVHRDGWGDEGTDQVPVHYRAQCLWQAEVMGAPRVRLAVMFLPSWELREYVVEPDPDDVAAMVAAGEEFQLSLAAGQPPEPDWTPATTATLKRLHPSIEDRDVEVPKGLALRYEEARRTCAAADERRAGVENELRVLLGDGRRAVCDGEPVVTRSVYTMSRIDAKALRVDQPEIAAKYTVTSTVDRLVPARRKKEP